MAVLDQCHTISQADKATTPIFIEETTAESTGMTHGYKVNHGFPRY